LQGRFPEMDVKQSLVDVQKEIQKGNLVTDSAELSQGDFFPVAKRDSWKPLKEEGVTEKWTFPFKGTQEDKDEYQNRANSEFIKFANKQDSEFRLQLQPIWNLKDGSYALDGMEVLARVKNGQDAAPLPALPNFLEKGTEEAKQFLKTMLDYASEAWKQLRDNGMQDMWVSVNVRPDEITADGIAAYIIQKVGTERANLLIEVVEYAPITKDVENVLRHLQASGVTLALDDVNHVYDPANPPKHSTKAFAENSTAKTHSCTVEKSIEFATLCQMHKLALPLCCSVYRVPVFTTPQYAGGQPNGFLKSCIFDDTPENAAEIQLRKQIVQDWYTQVSGKNPNAIFVIESTVDRNIVEQSRNPEALDKLYPNLPLTNGKFLMQGGDTGGRGFDIQVFVEAKKEKEAKCEFKKMLLSQYPTPTEAAEVLQTMINLQ